VRRRFLGGPGRGKESQQGRAAYHVKTGPTEAEDLTRCKETPTPISICTPEEMAKRTWQQAIEALIESKHDSTKARWLRSVKHAAFDGIRGRLIIETDAEHFLAVLKAGTISTDLHLRPIQDFALALDWLPRPIIPRRQ
jgi:hypothetical protein